MARQGALPNDKDCASLTTVGDRKKKKNRGPVDLDPRGRDSPSRERPVTKIVARVRDPEDAASIQSSLPFPGLWQNLLESCG